jgi:hypothetical protein
VTGINGKAYCGEFACSNQSTPVMCANQSDQDCAWNNASGSCGGGWHHGGSGGAPQMQAYGWRDTVQGLMAGHWYSTQEAGHCNASSAGCGWRVAEVKKVVNANCVNGQVRRDTPFSLSLSLRAACVGRRGRPCLPGKIISFPKSDPARADRRGGAAAQRPGPAPGR